MKNNDLSLYYSLIYLVILVCVQFAPHTLDPLFTADHLLMLNCVLQKAHTYYLHPTDSQCNPAHSPFNCIATLSCPKGQTCTGARKMHCA